MPKKIAFLILVALSVSACGPKSLPPIVEQGVVNDERRIQQEMILKDYLARVSRVDRVSFQLMTHNLVQCDEYDFLAGVVIMDAGEVYKPYREAAKVILSMDEKPKVLSLVPGAPAQKAGLQEGDVILSVDGNSVSSASSAGKRLRKERMATITVQRGEEQLTFSFAQDRACAYPVELKEEKILNAFAFGDRIWVTSGMVRFCRSDDELALILGHELAHNTMKHLDAKRDNMRLGSLLIDMPIAAITGINPGIGGAIGANAYSQDFETEADYVGLYNTARSGFDISGVSELWRRMAVENPDAVYVATSHPTTAQRFTMLEAAVKEIKAKQAAGQQLEPNMQQAK